MDPASRTAATLVRCMLADHPDRPGGAPEYVEFEPGADPSQAETDAWLSIGDRALRDALAQDAPPVFNPSAEWAARLSMPFVFAAWIIAPGVDIEPHLGAFRRAHEAGQARIDDLALQASVEWELPPGAARDYLARECTYDLGAQMHASMLAFRDLAAPLELCQGDLVPTPVTLSTTHA